jgi:hypothetical protein
MVCYFDPIIGKDDSNFSDSHIPSATNNTSHTKTVYIMANDEELLVFLCNPFISQLQPEAIFKSQITYAKPSCLHQAPRNQHSAKMCVNLYIDYIECGYISNDGWVPCLNTKTCIPQKERIERVSGLCQRCKEGRKKLYGLNRLGFNSTGDNKSQGEPSWWR